MCCGSKRSAFRNTSNLLRAPLAAPPVSQTSSDRTSIPAPSGQNPAGTIASDSAERTFSPAPPQHIETPGVSVRGPVTGRLYHLSGAQSAQSLDPRDAAVLKRSGLFRRA